MSIMKRLSLHTAENQDLLCRHLAELWQANGAAALQTLPQQTLPDLIAAISQLLADLSLEPFSTAETSPAAICFGTSLARRHRREGIGLTSSVELLKCCRTCYLDLVSNSGGDEASRDACVAAVNRLFDQAEVSFCAEWEKQSCSQKDCEQLEEVLSDLQKLEYIINRSPAVAFIWQLADGWPIEYVSENVAMWGYSAQKLGACKAKFSDIIHPDDYSRVFHGVLHHTEAHTEIFKLQYRILTAGGEVRWVEDNTWLQRDAAGEVVHFQGVLLDITDRVEAEEQAHTASYLLSSILQHAPVPMYVVECDLTMRMVNSAWSKAVGISVEEAVGKNLVDFVGDEMAKLYAARVAEIMRTGKPLETQVTLELNGQKKHFHSVHFPILDTSGRLDAIGGFSLDMTESMEAQDALRRSENLLSRVFDILPIGLWFADKDGTLLRGNPAGVKIWGGEPKVGPEKYDVFKAWRLPGGEEVTKDDWALLRSVTEGVTITDELLEIEAFDGTKKVILNYTAPVLDDAGEIQGAVVVNLDVTNRQRAEQQIIAERRLLEYILESALAGYWDWNLVTNEEYLSPTFKRMFGYEDHELPNSVETWQKLIFPEDLKTVQENFEQHIASSGKLPFYNEVRYRHKDGSTIWVICAGRVMEWDDEGNPLRMAGCHIDITDRKKLEDNQRMAALGQLAAGVAHDFNNILTGIQGIAQLVELGRVEPQRLVEIVQRNATRGGEITHSLLAFARPSEGKREAGDITGVIDDALQLASREIENASIRVERKYQPISRQVTFDHAQMEQVFLNLVINAGHAMPRGGTLTVSTRVVTNGGSSEKLEIAISDTGEGIEPEYLSRIFEPFFTTKGRLDESEISGSGLGLSVALGIISAHGGEISVESTPGKGTTFIITLPFAEGGKPPADENDRRVADNMTQQKEGRILVAEDEESILAMLKEAFDMFGYEVITVADAKEAVAALGQSAFDVVITDFMMPGGGGAAILEQTQSMDNPPPVIVITGMLRDTTKEEIVEAGAALCLSKPFNLRELVDNVQQLMTERT